MKQILTLIALTVSLHAGAQIAGGPKRVYTSPNLEERKKEIRTVAILPMTVKIAYREQPVSVTLEMIKHQEEKGRTSLQQGLYTFMLRKQKNYTVTIQNPDRTNVLLKNAGLYNQNDLDAILPDSLASLLGVDCVIKSTWDINRTGSETANMVLEAFLGFSTNTSSIITTFHIFDGKDGELLWRFYDDIDEFVGLDSHDIMERMMRKIGRNFPLASK